VFGLFKKKVTPAEFGHAVLYTAVDWIGSDAGRALGMRFENSDGSQGWDRFLESRGVPIATQKLHTRHYAHCAVQTISTRYARPVAFEMVWGAMNGFNNTIEGYDFVTAYETLDAAYQGRHRFSPAVESLRSPELEARGATLALQNAKYLMETFVLPYMPNAAAYIAGFSSYSITCYGALGTVSRALDQVSKKLKMPSSPQISN
jgi:hypothetical protein